MEFERKTMAEVKALLKVHKTAYVIMENNDKIYVSPSKLLLNNNESNMKLVETFNADDFYSKKEQMLNYMNTYGDYHKDYNGERNPALVEKMMVTWKDGAPSIEVTYDDYGNIVERRTSLTPIGNGSKTTLELGDTSWMLEDDGNPLLVDCGSTVFSKLIEKDLLHPNLKVIITHLHAGNVGSLGSLIEYYHYVRNEQITIYVSSFIANELKQLLWLQGIKDKMYELVGIETNLEIFAGCEIAPFETKHVFLEHFKTFGWKINYNGKRIIYSGDWREIPEEILDEINNLTYDEMYLDVSMEEINPTHLTLSKLASKLNLEALSRVTIIHKDK